MSTSQDRAPGGEVFAFIARVDRTYNRYILEVPPEALSRLGAEEGDYLVITARKAKWYHLIAWNCEDLNDPDLADEIKQEVRRYMAEHGKGCGDGPLRTFNS